MDFEQKYKENIEKLNIPELSVDDIFSGHKLRKRMMCQQFCIGIIITVTLLVGISSVSVYAFDYIRRSVRETANGVIIERASDENDGAIVHDYSDDEAFDKEYYHSGTGGLKFYSSWDQAIEDIPYDISYPLLEQDVSIAVQDGMWFLVEAAYTFGDNSDFTIEYDFYRTDNWESEREFNGKIIERGNYINKNGNEFKKTVVSIDEDVCSFYVITYDNVMVQAQFRNVDAGKQEEILDTLNF